VTGCSKISPGCKNCYAERMHRRLQAMGQPHYQNDFNKIALHPDSLEIPLKWRKSQIIFVNSMGDLFHKDVPKDFIISVFNTMNKARHHIFQVLTKRAERRLADMADDLPWPENVWMGVSIENQKSTFRSEYLALIPAAVKFLSIEPLIAEINDLPLRNIDWVIVGGESGPKSRPIQPDWVRNIRDLCKVNDVPFFFKQWGGWNKKKNGRVLDGKIWDEMPAREIIPQ
ncbi:MAG: phage Gp37/Gp68 family protein, partial [bacterium]